MRKLPVVLVAALSILLVTPAMAATRSVLLKVDSSPSQANVYALEPPPGQVSYPGESRLVGRTPLTASDLRAGEQTLELEKEGYIPESMRVYLDPGDAVDLGTIPLAKRGSSVTIWVVGEPRREPPPPVIPAHAATLVKGLGFSTNIRGIGAEEFPGQLRDASKNGERPDILVGTNFLPFDSVSRSNFVHAEGVLNHLAPFVFLVSDSPNFAAARHIALSDPEDLSPAGRFRGNNVDLGGDSAYQEQFKDLNWQATAAYLKNDKKKLQSLAAPEMLRKGASQLSPVGADPAVPVLVSDVKLVYAQGNSHLAFVLGKASYVANRSIGGQRVFSVWIKQGNSWKLLTISDDPLTLQIATSKIPECAAQLRESPEHVLPLAELISPANGKLPSRGLEQRFGEFAWRNSDSPDVLAEVAEFEYGTASRLFFNPKGRVSEGELWTTNTPWSWRIWTIGHNGQIFFSETRHFQN